MMESPKLDETLEVAGQHADSLRRRWGDIRFGIILTAILMFLAGFYVRPATHANSHGRYYAEISKAPFASSNNPNAHRVLTPLLSYTIGMRGDRIVVTNLLVIAALVFSTYRFGIASGWPTLLATLSAASMMFSMPALVTFYFGGYPDAMTCLLALLMMQSRSAWRFGALYFLALSNHEASAFYLPLFLVRAFELGRARSAFSWGAAAGLSIAAYCILRQSLLDAADTAHDVDYYLLPLGADALHNLRQVASTYCVGWFTAFKLLWIFPILGVWFAWHSKRWLSALQIAIILACSCAQTALAIDTTRMVSFSFPALLIGLEQVRINLGGKRTVKLLLIILALNFLVPQLYVWGSEIAIMRSLPGALIRAILR